MRRFVFYSLLLCLLVSFDSYAQTFEKSSYFGAKVLFLEYEFLNGESQPTMTNGIELLYQRDLGRKLILGVPLRFGVIKVPEDLNNRNIGGLDVVLKYSFFPDTSKVNPYLMGGGGGVSEELDRSYLQVTFGGGLNFKVGSHSYVNLQGELRPSMEENRNGIHLGLGYIYRFVRDDQDRDGVVDHMDDCPEIPGTLNGCPDKDGDRIPDKNDLCPEIPGRRATDGCPDSDRDGITDKDDPCPEEAGDYNGCPDSDGDGVGDGEDKCPDQRGIIAMNGCPDSDGDGIADPEDNCPGEPGAAINNGCPVSDRDGDGIADEDDQCPDEIGLVATNGCPDSDGDGVPNGEDRCPEKAGPFDGCPDTDQDGIMDADDGCPDQPGEVANNGCPELEKEDQEVLDEATKAVQFEKDQAILLPESYPVLDQVVDLLQRYPGYQCRISGYTDSLGEASFNQQLSEQRALACYQYLVTRGISQSRLSYFGFGAENPVASNDTREGRRLNRRVEFELFIE